MAYAVVDGYIARTHSVPLVVADCASNIIWVVALAPFALRATRAVTGGMRGSWRHSIGVGVLWSVAYIHMLRALAQGAPLLIVAPLREMTMIVGAVLGMAVLGKWLGSRRIICCAVLTEGDVALGMARDRNERRNMYLAL